MKARNKTKPVFRKDVGELISLIGRRDAILDRMAEGRFISEMEEEERKILTKDIDELKSFIPEKLYKDVERDAKKKKKEEAKQKRKAAATKKAKKSSNEIVLSRSQTETWDLIQDGHNVGVFGEAGTGKTTLLKKIMEPSKTQYSIPSIVVAPTGIAAINCSVGAKTIHSMFRVPFHKPFPKDDIRYSLPLKEVFKLGVRQVNALKHAKRIVIDEISMVRSDLMDVMDHILRSIDDPFMPFGGKQVIVFGDPMQLAPVTTKRDWVELKDTYKSGWFFDSYVWKEADFKCVSLREIFRQKDKHFISFLNKIRNGSVSEKELEDFNDKHFNFKFDINKYVQLSTHNAKVDRINEDELEKLEGPEVTYLANIKGRFPESLYPLAPAALHLRKDARVMFVKNMLKEYGVINGTMGKVEDLQTDHVSVLIDGDRFPIRIDYEDWKNLEFVVSDGKLTTKTLGVFSQIPLRLAFALSIHKSQGLSFDKASLDLENSFAEGQAYVALSRLTSDEHLNLLSRLDMTSIKCDPRAVEFYNQIDNNNNKNNQDETRI